MSSATIVAERRDLEHMSARPDFPVCWEHPEDESRSWIQDRMHQPAPVLPLERAFWALVYDGFTRAAAAYEMPVRIHFRCMNTYAYLATAPAVEPGRMDAQAGRADARIDAAMTRLATTWEAEWLPEIRSHLAWWDAFDLHGSTTERLLAHLDETIDRWLRLWELHFQIVVPSYAAMSRFDDLYQDLFAADGAFGAYQLLQGFDNKTLEAGRALWALGRRALDSAAVRRALEARTASEVLGALETTPDGRAFRAEIQTYLETYGLRGDIWGLSHPAWIEDPTPVINNLKAYAADAHPDPTREQAALAAERERMTAAALGRLRGYPQPIVEEFACLLAAAREGVVLSEDHGFWIDFGATYRVRRLLLEFGRRLVRAGALARPADVFYLTLDEVRTLAVAPSSGDRHALVAARWAEVEAFRAVNPPPTLGAESGPPADDTLSRFFGKFFGRPAVAADDPTLLTGSAGAPGKVRGRARVVRSLAEAARLQPGDILVAETTAPPWTPLFATVAAIVTDTGGILSHCAVVAREYRIPAVVGTGRATTAIRDGEFIEVDGDAGLVRIG